MLPQRGQTMFSYFFLMVKILSAKGGHGLMPPKYATVFFVNNISG